MPPSHDPVADDVVSEYGLLGYHCHIALHNGRSSCMSGSFHNLFCRKGNFGLYGFCPNDICSIVVKFWLHFPSTEQGRVFLVSLLLSSVESFLYKVVNFWWQLNHQESNNESKSSTLMIRDLLTSAAGEDSSFKIANLIN